MDLSIVIPAYNEEKRLPPALKEIADYLSSRDLQYEILVVDDGSSDGTSDVVKSFQIENASIKLLKHPCNSGKGAAVRTGGLASSGARVLFADADGSTPIIELERLEKALEEGADIAIGSRAKPSTETEIKTVWYRKLLGRSFNLYINLIILPGFADTQCGFKLFSSASAGFLFSNQQSNGFSFDIEILYLARKANLRIDEVPVNWENVPGSKVNLALDALRMARDSLIFKFRHWTVTPQAFEKFKSSNSA